METIYNKADSFEIEGITIELISENMYDEVYNTFYIIDNYFYCLGDEPIDIQTAIMAYENFFDIKLADSKVDKLYKDYLNENFR